MVGGSLALRLDVPLDEALEWFVDLSSKTKGWQAGNVYLDDELGVGFGLNYVLLP